ncbi:MAG TPA: MFS transporter [Kouleothrix sp.]|uniref:MFS transporter n=1 Tax=Kouleothrix sp. TaxID=2779161 RepID=UPI002CEB9E63|nr:MFS transporter [Kouleothrix sp.]HRC75204.1 MFS transporter [Kouleothrix sp.]
MRLTNVKSPAPAAEARPEAGVLGRLARGFHALQVRNYRLFWVGQLISQTGSWMQRTAQDWLVLQLTHSPFALGLVTALQFLPVLLLSLVGGVITDRWSKHRLVTITQVSALVQAALFAALVASGAIQLWHVYVLALLQGIITAIDNPVRQAFVVELVGREHLVNAVALNSMLFNGARIVGPAVAGLMIAGASNLLAGIALVLVANAVSFVAVLAGLLMIDPAALWVAPPAPAGNMGQRLLEGLAYVWRTPAVLLVMIVVAAIGTFGYNFSVVLPLLSGFVLHTSAAGYGGLSAFLGFGSLVGALSTAYTRQVTVRRLIGGSIVFSILLGLVAISTNFTLSGGLLVALGFAGILFSTSANTLLQLTVPDALRGRVLSLYMLLFAGSTPIGGFLIGSLSNVIGVSETLLLCAGLCLLGVGGALVYRWRTQ